MPACADAHLTYSDARGVQITGFKGYRGGAEGNRTPDLLIANEALYQLSYSPTNARNIRGFTVLSTDELRDLVISPII